MSWNAPGPEDRISLKTVVLIFAAIAGVISGFIGARYKWRAYFTTPAAVSEQEKRISDLERRVNRLENSRYVPETAPAPRSFDQPKPKSHLMQPGETYDDWYRRVGPIIPAGDM